MVNLVHKRNVVKCEGATWCETNILRNLKRQMWAETAYYIPTFWKSGGTRPTPSCDHDLV